MNSNVKVSVIVPCYNAQERIRHTLDSLRAQTLRDIEIICIDDKSTDDTLQILREYEKRDKRLHIIEMQNNSGASAARNAGLAAARGEYIGFVDADDYVDADFYENLYNRAAKTKADIVKGLARVIGYDGRVGACGPDHAKIAANRAYFHYTFWSAIYRRDFIQEKSIDFQTGIIVAQDVVFLLKAVMLAERIELIDSPSYYYYWRMAGSLDSERLSDAKVKSNIEAFNIMIDFLNDHDIERNVYNVAFGLIFNYLMCDMFWRNNSLNMQVLLLRESIGLFAKCKYQDDYIAKFPLYGVCLRGGSELSLMACLVKYSRDVRVKLFGIIPLIKVRSKPDKRVWRLFGLLPVWSVCYKVKNDTLANVHKFLDVLPIFVRY